MNITSFILSIIGVVILEFLSELIMPNGIMQKYIKGFFALLMMLVLLYPISRIEGLKFDFNSGIFNENAAIIDNEYMDNYLDNYKKFSQKTIITLLENSGFYNVEVEVFAFLSENEIKVSQVNLNLKNLVIDKNKTHINKYTEMQDCVLKVLEVEKEQIEFCQ